MVTNNKGLVTDKPVKGATFTFVPETTMMKATGCNGADEIVKTTAEKGIFHIKSMPEGTYNVTVKKPGYKEKLVSVSVAHGEMAELDVVLDKI